MVNTKTLRLIDKGAVLFTLPISAIRKRERNIKRSNRRILFIQLWGIGESILTLPAIHAVRKLNNKAEISVLLTDRNREVFRGQPFIDRIEEVSINPLSILSFIVKHLNHYDLVVDFEEYLETTALIALLTGKQSIGFCHKRSSKAYNRCVVYDGNKHTAEVFFDLARVLGASRMNGLEKLSYSNEDKEHVDKIVKGRSRLIGIAPGAAESSKSRMWPAERFSMLADMLLKDKKNTVVFIGAGWDKNIIGRVKGMMKSKERVIDTSGKLTLKQTIALISHLNLLVSNDSGPMHIGAAQRTPTIGLFGPNTPVRWAPLGKKNLAIYHKVSCSPCINSHLGQFPECRWKGTPKERMCMKKIHIEEVYSACLKLLQPR